MAKRIGLALSGGLGVFCRVRFLPAPTAALALLVGCGSGETPPPAESAPAPVAEPISEPTPPPAAAPVGMPPIIDLDRVGELAVNQRAEVAAREAGVRSAQAELRGIRAQRVPDLTANGGFKRQSDGFSGLFLGISVPLPFWNRSRGGVEAAEARVTGGPTHLSLARMEGEADARRALAVYHSQMQRAELLSDVGQEPSVDLLEIAQFAYDAGEMDLIDLLDAAEALHDAEVAVVRIRSEVWISYYDLERAVGGFGDLGGQGEDDE